MPVIHALQWHSWQHLLMMIRLWRDLGLQMKLTLVDCVLDGLVIHPMLDLLFLSFASLDGTYKTATRGVMCFGGRHIDQWRPCHASHMFLFPSREMR